MKEGGGGRGGGRECERVLGVRVRFGLKGRRFKLSVYVGLKS